jgi:hypothetical protein
MKKNILIAFVSCGLVSVFSCNKSHVKPVTNSVDSSKIGVVAYYPFTGNAADSSGNGFNGTVNGATLTNNRFGKANSAYYFDGTNNISVADATALRLNNTDFTINAWVRLDDFNTSSLSSAVVDKRTTNGQQLCWYLGINGTVNSTPTGEVYYGPGGGYPGITSANGIPVNTWTMVTAVYSLQSQSVKIYIDGLFSSQSQTSIATPDAANNATVYIGSDNPAIGTNYYLKGSIDDIRIYNRAISSHEIGELFVRSN